MQAWVCCDNMHQQGILPTSVCTVMPLLCPSMTPRLPKACHKKHACELKLRGEQALSVLDLGLGFRVQI